MTLKLTTNERAAAKQALHVVAAPPPLRLSEWADAFLFLSSENSAEPGKYSTARTPYVREPMDCITSSEVEEIILLWASQTGKTTIFNAATGYYIHQDPSPVMMVQPTKEMGEAWSKDRFVPMVRDTPVLNQLVNINVSRDGENTIMHKRFPGGNLTIAGANSPASLASRPKRVMMLDEVDRFPRSAKKEGRPSGLAIARTSTFWNRKILKSSSPTIKGESEIEEDYDSSDKRKYWVKCPHCGEMQKMVFEKLQWPDGEPEKAVYVCAHHGCIMQDGDKYYMLAHGEWRAEMPFKGRAGFQLSALYSPWVPFGTFARQFVESKADPEKLKVFINTKLAETYEENIDGEGVEEDSLIARVEDYSGAPEGVLIITMAVDTQDDRLEYELRGWGVDEESWLIDYRVIHGDPGLPDVWRDLNDILESKVRHARGINMTISTACIDAGGHHAESVYKFCKTMQRQGRRVYAIRGASQSWRPVISKMSNNNSHKVKMFIVGTDTAKDTIFSRLKSAEPGAGYCHFPAHIPDHYFTGLTSEKLVKRYHKGRTTKQYIKKTQSARNEPLDLFVYSLAALKTLTINWNALKLRLDKQTPKNTPPTSTPSPHTDDHEPTQSSIWRTRRGRGNVSRWRS
jgi:phage terminase large subunit GpA-like protein